MDEADEENINNKNNNINDSINSSYISSSSSGEDEENNNTYDDYQGPYTSPSEDIINEEIQLKENYITKIIKEKGDSLYKPKDVDNVLINCFGYYFNENKEKKELKNFCEFKGEKEINLENKILPRSLALCIQSMRVNEFSIFKIKFNYIFRFLDSDKKADNIYSNLIPNEFFDENFRKKNSNEKIFFEVKLINYFRIINITKIGEKRKKIISKEKTNAKPNESDIIIYNIKCLYKNDTIYEYNNRKIELDKAFNNKEIFDIELYLIKNSYLNEKNCFLIDFKYLSEKYKKFLDDFPQFLKSNLQNLNLNDTINNNNTVEFYLEIINIEHYDYVYKYKNKNNTYAKSKILYEGFGLACPDEEMFVKFKFQLKIDGEMIFNSFNDFIDIEKDYISEKNKDKLNEEVKWRNQMKISRSRNRLYKIRENLRKIKF